MPAHSIPDACNPHCTCVRPVKVATRRQPTVRPARLSSDPRTVGLLTLQRMDVMLVETDLCMIESVMLPSLDRLSISQCTAFCA